jgi:hypothetical protein
VITRKAPAGFKKVKESYTEEENTSGAGSCKTWGPVPQGSKGDGHKNPDGE